MSESPAAAAQPQRDAEREAVAAVSLAWKKAYNERDLDAVTDLYTEDAVLSIPGQPNVQGRAAVLAMFAARIPKAESAELTVEDAPLGEIALSGDLAWQWKTFRMVDRGGRTVGSGTLVTLYRKENGRWLIAGDISTFENPAVNVVGGK